MIADDNPRLPFFNQVLSAGRAGRYSFRIRCFAVVILFHKHKGGIGLL